MHTPPLLLIVDDEEYFREIFSVKLTSLGYAVATAENGAEGVTKAGELQPDLILMDVQMPVKGGFDAFTDLKSRADTRNIKLIFLTNLGELRDESQLSNNRFAQEIGATGYLHKTDDLDSLTKRILEHLPHETTERQSVPAV